MHPRLIPLTLRSIIHLKKLIYSILWTMASQLLSFKPVSYLTHPEPHLDVHLAIHLNKYLSVQTRENHNLPGRPLDLVLQYLKHQAEPAYQQKKDAPKSRV